MTIHIIRVIRELTDTGLSSAHQKKQILCSDTHSSRASYWNPNTDIFEDKDFVIIRIELAGVKREDISLVVKSGKLIITGVRCEDRSNNLTYHQLEMNFGAFQRIISIPESIEHNEIEATFKDGILTVKISKQSNAIEIPIIFETEKK